MASKKKTPALSGPAKVFVLKAKAERVKRDLSQADLAQKAGLSVSYVSMLERGQREPPLSTLEVYAKALRVSPAWLITPPEAA